MTTRSARGLLVVVVLFSGSCGGHVATRPGDPTHPPVGPGFVAVDPPTDAWGPGTILRKSSGTPYIADRCVVQTDTSESPIWAQTGAKESQPLSIVFGKQADTLFSAGLGHSASFSRSIHGGELITTTDVAVRGCRQRFLRFLDSHPQEEGAYYLVREVIRADSVTFGFDEHDLRKGQIGVTIDGVGANVGSSYVWRGTDTLVERFKTKLIVYMKEEPIRSPNRSRAVLESILVPGAGQFKNGTPHTGTLVLSGAVLGAAGWLVFGRMRRNRLDAAQASLVQSEHDRLVREVNTLGHAQNLSGGVALAAWVFGIADAAFGRIRIRSALAVETHPQSQVDIGYSVTW